MNRNFLRNIAIVSILTLIISCLATGALAEEIADTILRSLVEELDRSVSEFESRLEDVEKDSSTLTQNMKGEYAAWKGATDDFAREENAARLSQTIAKMNKRDLEKVLLAKSTLSTVAPLLRDVIAEIRLAYSSGSGESEDMESLKTSTITFMTNVANVIANIRSISNDEAEKSTIFRMEQQLLLMQDLLSTRGPEVEKEVKSLEEAVSSLEAIYTNMVVLEGVLQQERAILRARNLAQIARICGLRFLEHGILETDSLHKFSRKILDDVTSRQEIMRDTSVLDGTTRKSSARTRKVERVHAAADSITLQEIRSGRGF